MRYTIIHYIAQIYTDGTRLFTYPDMGQNAERFHGALYIILEIAFPKGKISGEARNFGRSMVTGIEEQLDAGFISV